MNLSSAVAIILAMIIPMAASGCLGKFPIRATALLQKPPSASNSNWEGIGVISFAQASKSEPVLITGNITGLKPSASVGFHVHDLGSIFPDCSAAGTHFNPFNMTHGGPTDAVRHIGDLGNIQTDSNGVSLVNIQMPAEKFPLTGRNSIIGRTMLVHADTDDLGKGGFNDSLTTGHAGARVGCGVIGYAKVV